MKFEDLNFSEVIPFSGFQGNLETSDVVIFGVPFDGTSSYFPGSKFAPDSIRNASLNVETFDLESSKDPIDVPLYDLGNLNVTPLDVRSVVKAVDVVEKWVIKNEKFPMMLGGEHTITLGALNAMRSIERGFKIVYLDAHMDLREELNGLKLSHATVLRRIIESIDVDVIMVGTRACSREEVEFAERNGIRFYLPREVDEGVFKELKGESVYVSLDFDVMDPSIMRGVGNPEPGGFSYNDMILIIDNIFKYCEVLGIDFV
ncbi:MAG: agmatinase, partial [Candidatus Odinarchaeota archaeon]|nr:agmatinase [Candidatus Odinarchaeota archaeon]